MNSKEATIAGLIRGFNMRAIHYFNAINLQANAQLQMTSESFDV